MDLKRIESSHIYIYIYIYLYIGTNNATVNKNPPRPYLGSIPKVPIYTSTKSPTSQNHFAIPIPSKLLWGEYNSVFIGFVGKMVICVFCAKQMDLSESKNMDCGCYVCNRCVARYIYI